MRLVTWNINSVRLRIGLVLRLLRETNADILCLQETKSPDEFFPVAALREAGYPYIHFHGMKGYNGVAIISRVDFNNTEVQHWCDRQDCRHALAVLPGGIELHNIYVPAGGDIPDPDLNPKFAHKLRFLDELRDYFAVRAAAGKQMIVVGDLNVAPLEHDVWSHKQLLGIVSHTPVEVKKLTAWQAAGGFIDTMRQFVPVSEKLYTWWSYRNQDWKLSNRGRRLDHIWTTPDVAAKAQGMLVLREVRDWEKSSDHVPVLMEMDL